MIAGAVAAVARDAAVAADAADAAADAAVAAEYSVCLHPQLPQLRHTSDLLKTNCTNGVKNHNRN